MEGRHLEFSVGHFDKNLSDRRRHFKVNKDLHLKNVAANYFNRKSFLSMTWFSVRQHARVFNGLDLQPEAPCGSHML